MKKVFGFLLKYKVKTIFLKSFYISNKINAQVGDFMGFFIWMNKASIKNLFLKINFIWSDYKLLKKSKFYVKFKIFFVNCLQEEKIMLDIIVNRTKMFSIFIILDISFIDEINKVL